MKIFFIVLGFLLLPLPSSAANAMDVVINEIAWMGTKNSANDEWIELYNNTDSSIDLSGWAIYEDGGETLVEPLNGAINAGGYYLIERTDDTTVPTVASSQEPTSWGGHGLINDPGEHLVLLDGNGKIIDQMDGSSGWPAGDNSTKQTMERKDNAWQTSKEAGGTPGAQNSVPESLPAPPQPDEPAPPTPTDNPQPAEDPPASAEPNDTPPEQTEGFVMSENQSPTSENLSFSENIFINEIMPSPVGGDGANEWIEIFNADNEPADISNWRLRDTSGAINTYTFSSDTSISPGTYIVLSRLTTKVTLNNDSDGLELIWPTGKIIDSAQYTQASEGKSYSKNAEGWAWSNVPTPGSANIISSAKEEPPLTNTEEIKKPAITANNNFYQKSKTAEIQTDSQDIKENAGARADKNLAALDTAGLNKASGGSNLFVYTIAPLIAALSALFMFLLKKHLGDRGL